MRISHARSVGKLSTELSVTLLTIILIGIFLVLVGLLIYPLFVMHLLDNSPDMTCAKIIIYLLTISIFPEFIRFSMSLCLQSIGKHKFVLYNSWFEVVLNIVCNVFFAYYMSYGLIGLYIGTLVTSTITSLLFFLGIKKHLNLSQIRFYVYKFRKLLKKIIEITYQIYIEATRIFAQRMIYPVLIYASSYFSYRQEHLIAIGLAFSFIFFLNVPIVSLMRAVIISLNHQQIKTKQKIYLFLKPVIFISLSITCIIGFILLMSMHYIFYLFKIHGGITKSWLHAFYYAQVFLLPLETLHSIQRAILYRSENLTLLRRADTVCTWSIIVPIFIIGLCIEQPMLAWFSFVCSTLISILWVNKYEESRILYRPLLG